MSVYELHNFIEDYPSQDSEDIQWNISSRKEFNELISDKIKLEKVDRFFKHQQVFLRYLRQYDFIFNIQATGTGKSGSLINAAEFFKKSNSNIKRIYVLEPGDQTIRDFKKQVVKLSDPEEYSNDKVKYSMSKSGYNNSINRLIKEWYTVETYRSFAKKNYSDKTIIEEFSDCLFFLDEAHDLRNLKDNKGTNLTEKEIDNVYSFLWRVTHLAQRSKFVVATATPMVNEVFDFVNIFNLVLPMDKQLPLHPRLSKDFYNRVTIDALEPYFRGKITFIKFSEDKINVLNQGTVIKDYIHKIEVPLEKIKKSIKPTIKKIENGKIVTIREPRQEVNETKTIGLASQIKLVNLVMEGNQLETYTKVVKEKSKQSSFYANELQTSTFVYPNGDYGSKGFNNYVTKDDLGEYIFKDVVKVKKSNYPGLYGNYLDSSDLEKSLENLKLMSVKFHFYIQKELKHSMEANPGNSFCYIEYNKASGASLLAMLLNIFGFREYTSNFEPIDRATKKIIIPKAKRFMLLTGETKNSEALAFFNHPANRNGEYIQILIATQVAQVGINVKNVRRGYIMTPGWHESGMYQAISRFIRADSHDLLYEIEGKKIDVEVYRLNATIPKGLSIDTKLYLDSERKDIHNKRILRFMKRCAFDAFLNYDRNINLPKGTENGDSLADYGKIDYKIFSAVAPPGNKNRKGMALNQGPNKSDYIYNTYNLLYSENLIKKVKKDIKKIISEKLVIDIKTLREMINATSITDYIFNTAIEEIIYNKEIIANNQNTIYYHMSFNSDLLFLKRETSYSEINRINTENDLYLDVEFPELTKVIDAKDSSNLEDFYEKYSNLTLEEVKNYYIQTQDYLLFKALIEDSLIRLKNKNLNNLNKIIIKLFSNYILIIDKPISYLEASEKALVTKGEVKQGRKRASESKVGLTKLNLGEIKDVRDKEKVFLHFYRETEDTAYAINSIFKTPNKKIRVLEKDNNKFREATIAEEFVYNYFFTKEYEKIMEKFMLSKYYATIIYRGGQGSIMEKEAQFFRIIDTSDKNNRGKACGSYSIDNLLDILRYLDTEGKYKKFLNEKIKKPKLCPILSRLFEKNNLLFSSL